MGSKLSTSLKTLVSGRYKTVLFVLALTAAITPWFVIRIQQATNNDVIWLAEAMRRILAGGTMTSSAYDPNPPLSMLIYILPVLGHKYLSLSLPYLLFFQTVFLGIFSTAATYKILKSWGTLLDGQIYALVTGFVIAITVCVSFSVSERDHLIAMTLFPFILMQLSLTLGYKCPKGWKIPVFIIGSIFILVKPHYGLLPTLILAHRTLKRKNLSILKDPDFITLSASTLLYVLLVITIFPDYAFIILPDALHLYLPEGSWKNVAKDLLSGSALCLLMTCQTFFFTKKGFSRNLLFFLIFASMINLIPVLVQGMPFYYHLLPFIAFIGPAAALVCLEFFRQKINIYPSLVITMLFIISAAYIYIPLNLKYARASDYAHFPLTKLLKKECANVSPCTFFMINTDMGIIHETAYYSGIMYASRFPALWFMPAITDSKSGMRPSPLTHAQARLYMKRYYGMVADDIQHYKPRVILSVLLEKTKNKKIDTDYTVHINVIKELLKDNAFKKAWQHYKRINTITLSYKDYYADIAQNRPPYKYAVYERIP